VGWVVLNRKPVISLKRGKIGPRLLLMTNRKSHIRAFDWCQNQRLRWPWRAITHCVSKHMRLSEPTTKIWIKIDTYYQRRRCSPMTHDSGNTLHKVYADIRGGSQDLCKFCLDFMPARIHYTSNACHSRFQVQVFGLWQLATNRAAASSRVRD